MVIVLTSKYPMGVSEEVASVHMKLQKDNPRPDFMNRLGPFVLTDHDKGVTVMQIFEMPPEKLSEGFMWAMRMIAPYSDIPNVTVTARVWSELPEAASSFGIKIPEN